MKITDIRVDEVSISVEGRWHECETGLVQPGHVYGGASLDIEAMGPRVREGLFEASQLFLSVETDAGIRGLFGPIRPLTAFIIETELAPFLRGRDPRPVELLWDQMRRLRWQGASGDWITAIGAVDCALWDIRGRHYDVPVYELLGGPARDRIEALGSMMNFSIREDLLAQRAQEYASKGFASQKWMIPFGPGSGRRGMEENERLLRTLRRVLGDDYPVALDAWSGWELDYAVQMTRRLAPLRPFWIEEPLAVDRLDAYRRLKSETGAPIASGEHRHTRWEHKPFFDAGVLDIAQFDVLWVGGISESVKLCTLASAYDLRVMPHGGCMHATLHVIAAIPEWRCPLVSYVPQLIEKDQAFLARKLRCEGGFMDLPPGPGLGLELDERVVRARRRVSFIPESGAR